MSEAEALEVAGIWSGNILTAFTIYISFTFAYLVTEFYVGDRLGKMQAICVSVLYVFAATSAVLAQIGYMQAQFRILAEVPTVLDGVYLVTSGEFWIPYMAFMQTSGIFLSAYFMWSVKHQGTERS